MQYMLLIYGDESQEARATPAQGAQMMAAYTAYTDALRTAGVLRGADRLKPVSSATTVRVEGGKTHLLDGPYADTKEQLGGYYIVDVPDLDAALSWAARCAGASTGKIEVRPVWAM